MNDLERFSVLPIVREHYRALRAPGRKYVSAWTVLVTAGVPLLVGAAAVYFQVVLPRSAVGPLITGSALLVGALISAFVLFTNLRIKIYDEPKWAYRVNVSRLVAQTAVSCLYTVMVGLLIVAGLVAGISVPILYSNRTVLVWGTAVVAALATHLAVNFSTVVRRMFGVYFALFQADYDPILIDVTQLPDRKQRRGA